MTVIVAHHLLEGPVLVSDSRATQRKTGNGSDTATKIFPLFEDCIVGIVGNPHQAAEILLGIRNVFLKDGRSIYPENISKTVIDVANDTVPIDVNDSKCKLIFCYLDRRKRQCASIGKIRFHWNRENKPIVPANEALPLIMRLMSNVNDLESVEFNFPKSEIMILEYPFPSVRKLELLDMDAWGSGGEFVKSHLEKDFYKLWSLESYKDVPWFKTMIMAISMQDIIKKGEAYNIGGLPQVVALTPQGIYFQSYKSGEKLSMRYINGSWEQKNLETGRIIRTIPGILGKRKFDRSEVVEFSYFL